MPAPGVVRQFSFQFHATPAEVTALAHRWADELGLFLVEEFFGPPYVVRLAPLTDDPDRLPNRYSLSVDAPDLSALSARGLHDDAGMNFLLPKLTPQGLTEASVGGGTTDPDRLRLWRKSVRRLRDSCHAGARVVSPSGSIADVPAHRHTEGAHQLAARRTPMIAFVGGSRYEFDDVEHGSSEDLGAGWALLDDGRVVAKLITTAARDGSREGTLEPTRTFERFRPWFEAFAAAELVHDEERADLELARIRRALVLRHPDGHDVAEYIVRIRGNNATWLWTDDAVRGDPDR